MLKNSISFAVLFMVLCSLSGCFFGRTKIRVSDDGVYDIYSNENFICSTEDEDCSLMQRGTTSPVALQAVKDGQVAGRAYVSRSISVASVLWMPFTYCSSLFLYKAYPDEIMIMVDNPEPRPSTPWKAGEAPSSGSENGGSVWDKPLL